LRFDLRLSIFEERAKRAAGVREILKSSAVGRVFQRNRGTHECGHFFVIPPASGLSCLADVSKQTFQSIVVESPFSELCLLRFFVHGTGEDTQRLRNIGNNKTWRGHIVSRKVLGVGFLLLRR